MCGLFQTVKQIRLSGDIKLNYDSQYTTEPGSYVF